MILQTVLRRWRRHQILALGLRALGVALVGSTLVWTLLPPGASSWIVILAVALAFGVTSLWLPRPPLANRDLLMRHLDRVLPELEDSSDLVNRDLDGLTGLERLQLQRIGERLERIPRQDLWPRPQVVGSLRVLVGGILLALLIWVSQARWADRVPSPLESAAEYPETARGTRNLLSQVRVEIHPPVYTGLPDVQQSSLDITAPEGSRVRWLLPEASGRAAVVFVDGGAFEFRPGSEGVEAETVAGESSVYQIVVGSADHEQRSSYARLVVIADEPPRVRFIEPEERVTTATDPGVQAVPLRIEAEDEYGLESVELVTTLALGSGEMVEFRQHRQPLGPVAKGSPVTLEAKLDLPMLGLERGSELYFFVEASDRREPVANTSRSLTYILRVPGEAAASADLGEGLPIVMPPEYFRSQRQIIIDTEKLIAEGAQISRSELGRRSEGLGFDQRALRMRYGILLGEEFESGRPVEAGEGEADEDDDHEEHAAAEAGPLAGVPADLVHFHDSAEIATFFTSEIRTQLKQVLAQMWEAEGELRGHQPVAALPFEYRALTLLKDLQQRSRLYVQKVGFETPPLEANEVRLTGDLEEIGNRSRSLRPGEENGVGQAAETIVAVLQGAELPLTQDLAELRALVRAEIASRATQDPGELAALTAMDLWAAGEDLTDAESRDLSLALWRLVPAPLASPRSGRSSLDPLADLYRAALAERDRP